jgi:hypothetical protein
VSTYRRASVLVRAALCLLLVAGGACAGANTVAWRIGLANNASSEFSGASMPASYAIPADWATRTTWPEWRGYSASYSALVTDISYSLGAAPHGAEFIFKTIDASPLVPELAVFSNGTPCGVIQIVGTEYPGFGPPRATRVFGRTYRLYIPPEFLRQNASNTLRIRKLGHTYNRSLLFALSFTIDYMALEILSQPTPDPVHGKHTYMGVGSTTFEINTTTALNETPAMRWMGVAYSGNPQRVGFWSDIKHLQPARLQYVQALKDLNMTMIMDGLNCRGRLVGGEIPANERAYVDYIFNTYGSYFQYYELCNEPSMWFTHASLAYVTKVAQYINSIKPAHVRTAAPGYAYGGGYGDPVNWDSGANDANRIALEALCDVTNGHSYALSYCADNGSLIETIDTYGTGSPKRIVDGLPKEMINTECGANDWHQDIHEIGGNVRASILDRELRGEIGFCDRFTVFALWSEESFNFLSGNLNDPNTWTARTCGTDPDTRVKLFRRLALAYATHGKPLPYVYLNPAEVANQLVYFRAVDTSTLPPLPGSGAKADKILLNFVNFDTAYRRMAVRVTMPASGYYTGERFFTASTYNTSRGPVGLPASPDVTLDITLGPLESTQYIIDKPPPAAVPDWECY